MDTFINGVLAVGILFLVWWLGREQGRREGEYVQALGQDLQRFFHAYPSSPFRRQPGHKASVTALHLADRGEGPSER